MIKTFELNNQHRNQIIFSDKPFEYLYLMSYGHNKKNKNDLSYFTLNWRINETGQTISQYFNLYIKATPLAFNNERKNLLRILHACVKENISFAEVELKLQKRFLSESSSLFVTLEYPD